MADNPPSRESRWHLLRKGRVVASGDDLEVLDGISQATDLIVSEEEWRRIHWLRALREW